MTRQIEKWTWRPGNVNEGIEKIADHYKEPFTHGTMRLGLYAPRGTDDQQPHTQDELYFIISGTAGFTLEDERTEVSPGDALFVPAGAEHRFDNMSDDFQTWVVFWGQEGGEKEGGEGA